MRKCRERLKEGMFTQADLLGKASRLGHMKLVEEEERVEVWQV